jgi:hypothetical protein
VLELPLTFECSPQGRLLKSAISYRKYVFVIAEVERQVLHIFEARGESPGAQESCPAAEDRIVGRFLGQCAEHDWRWAVSDDSIGAGSDGGAAGNAGMDTRWIHFLV